MSLTVNIEPAKRYIKTTSPNLTITLSGEQIIHMINKQPASSKVFVFLDGIGKLDLEDLSDANYDAAASDSTVQQAVSTWMYLNGTNV